ncbi:Integral membrane protein DUF6 [Candidatus Zixiibacteriota bacterium]|nr:Integral membrane protein DUF6 [candidate division Zixibacteria bacterium]
MATIKNVSLPVLTALSFSGSFIAAKYTTLYLEPLTTTLFRYIIALLTLWVMALFYQKRSLLRVFRRDLIKFFLLGLFGIVGYHFFFFSSLKYTAVANSAIINAFNPAVTALMAGIFIKERLNGKNYMGLVVAMAGVILLVTRGHAANLLYLNFNLGDLLMLAAVVCWVIYSLIVKTISSKYSGLTITFYAALFGVGQLSLLALSENLPEQMAHISGAAIWALLYMGVVASGIGYLLFNLSIAAIGPTRTSSFTYSLVPIFVAILALVFFGEGITSLMIFSTVPIIAGLYLLAINRELSGQKIYD